MSVGAARNMLNAKQTRCSEEGGTVLGYWNPGSPAPDGHEYATLEAIAREAASLRGWRYVGIAGVDDDCTRATLVVPRDALSADEAEKLGVDAGTHVLGGIVPHSFVATKVIAHPLLRPGATAPDGWCQRFTDAVKDHVLQGYSAFSADEVREAGRLLLEGGAVRLKPAEGVGGRGQAVATSASDLDRFLATVDSQAMNCNGVVIEENLADVETFSVGQVDFEADVVSYVGVQKLVRDGEGRHVYGGSALDVVKGGWTELLASTADPRLTQAIRHAMRFDIAAGTAFQGMRLTRKNYDVIAGVDAAGRRRVAVLEQSWRIGGATPAELLALRALAANDAQRIVGAETVEVYGEADVPADAVVFYEGVDPRVGRLTKFARIIPHGNLSLLTQDSGR